MGSSRKKDIPLWHKLANKSWNLLNFIANIPCLRNCIPKIHIFIDFIYTISYIRQSYVEISHILERLNATCTLCFAVGKGPLTMCQNSTNYV